MLCSVNLLKRAVGCQSRLPREAPGGAGPQAQPKVIWGLPRGSALATQHTRLCLAQANHLSLHVGLVKAVSAWHLTEQNLFRACGERAPHLLLLPGLRGLKSGDVICPAQACPRGGVHSHTPSECPLHTVLEPPNQSWPSLGAISASLDLVDICMNIHMAFSQTAISILRKQKECQSSLNE
jgi:hypothetical protein